MSYQELQPEDQIVMKDDLPYCTCGKLLREYWENNGFTPPDPAHYECIGYFKCNHRHPDDYDEEE